ncbi:hypothetical protein BH23CHL3_BH23CHL3_10820 [soil metagenome]
MARWQLYSPLSPIGFGGDIGNGRATGSSHVYNDEGHGFTKREIEFTALRDIAGFLEERLALDTSLALREGFSRRRFVGMDSAAQDHRTDTERSVRPRQAS